MTGVKCTDKSRKMKRARRARKRLIAAMVLILLVLCVILVGILLFRALFREEHRAAEYEMEHYSQLDVDTPFLSADLCVVSEDISMQDAPDTDTFKAAGFFDLNQAETLYARNALKQVYPASTTKVMTAILALKYGNLSDVVTVTDAAWSAAGTRAS